MALSIIICEGKTDAILISYFLNKKYGVRFTQDDPPVKLLPDRHNNQSIKWYSIKENNKPSIAILGAGGIDNIPKTLSAISDRNSREKKEELRFTKIALYFDTDIRDKAGCKELFCKWLKEASCEYKEDKATLDNWFKACITLAGSNANKFSINLFIKLFTRKRRRG